MDDVFCAESSEQAHEPLAGTAAAEVEHWIVLEHDGPWGPKGLEDSGLAPEVVAHLTRFVQLHPRVRVQLVRRPDGVSPEPRLWLSGGAEGDEHLYRLTLASVASLLTLDLESWLSGTAPAGAARVEAPLYLICVHGRRDRCCARRGMPVYSAFAREVEESAFQTTHLGGHRFAATLVVLPAGVCYGRVAEADVPGIVRAHAGGKLADLALLRGRCRYPAAAQAAEIALRRGLALAEAQALSLRGIARGEGFVDVTFTQRETGTSHTERVLPQPVEALPASCGAAPKPGEAWVALRRA